MKRRRQVSRLYYLLLFALALSVALSSLYIREGNDGVLHKVKNRAVDLLSGPTSYFKQVYKTFTDWLYSVVHASAIKKENEKLRNDLKTARRIFLEAEALRKENEKLRKLLKLKSEKENLVAAEIIAVNQELSGKFYIINRGKKDGIKENQAVITADGVFGKIYSAGLNSSVILPINHPLSAVSARVVETGEVGIVEGSSSGKIYLKLIPKESKVSIGMVVVTSGLGGVYPKNLLIGTVKSVREDPNRLDLEIEVGPACSFDTSDFVLVITGN